MRPSTSYITCDDVSLRYQLVTSTWNPRSCRLTILFATESGSVSPSNYAHENYGRIKRRRMLHFSGTGEECVPASSPPFESSSANDLPFVVNLCLDTALIPLAFD